MASEEMNRLTVERINEGDENEIGMAFDTIRKTFTFYEQDLEQLNRQVESLPLEDLDADIEALRHPSSSEPAEISPQLRMFSEEVVSAVAAAHKVADQYLGQDGVKIENAIGYAADHVTALEAQNPSGTVIVPARQASERIVQIIASPEDPEASLGKRFAALELTPELQGTLVQLEDAVAMPPSNPDDKVEFARVIEKLKKHVEGFGNLTRPVSEIVDASKEVLSALA